jgi:hypothetical protein
MFVDPAWQHAVKIVSISWGNFVEARGWKITVRAFHALESRNFRDTHIPVHRATASQEPEVAALVELSTNSQQSSSQQGTNCSLKSE